MSDAQIGPASPKPPEGSPRGVWVTLAILLAAAGYFSFLVLRPFAGPLTAGAVLAVLFFPLHEWILRRIRRPSLAALLSTAIIVVAFLVPLVFVISIVVQELRDVYQTLTPNGVNSSLERMWASLERPLDTVAAWFGTTGEEIRASITGRLQELWSTAFRRVVAVVTAATGGAISVFIAIGTLYFALRGGGEAYAWVIERSPLGPQRTRRLGDAAHQMIVASFYGVIAVAATQGVLCGLGAWIAGLPAPALWGLAAAGASVLPLFGSALVWIPGAIYLFYQGSIGWGVFLLIWGAVLVANSDNVVRPLVLMTRVRANALLILIAILGGMQAFGLAGILFGPVVLAVTMALLELLREELKGVDEAG
jgi:predicted PurR-regulated permease PerM